MEILSQLWSVLGLITVLQNVLPTQIISLLQSLYESLQGLLSPHSYLEVPEFNGFCGVEVNELYRKVNLYLGAADPAAGSSHRLTALLSRSGPGNFSFSVAPNHSARDIFRGHALSWTHHVDAVPDSLDERRSFVLKLPKRHRGALLEPYLTHLVSRAEEAERASRERRLFTNNGHGSHDSGWASVPFRHPSTFETLALEPSLKEQLTHDLAAFSDGKEFYHRVGRAWKRGYLLHGPPGSGKSSLIAAMANFLRYDVYDLELTKVADNSELRSLLINTTNRSIIVIEDIDCSAELITDREAIKARKRTKLAEREEESTGTLTLSGILNFTDGLWSCCGEERIVIFTTNHVDSVDPALLRCGRMDVHVRLGACGAAAFRQLARNYLEVEEHVLMGAAERCIGAGGALTPAQVGEILLRNRGDADVAMREAVAAMRESCPDEGSGSPDSVLMRGSPENWAAVSPKKRKVKFLVRLRSLTKSDSGRKGV